MKTNFVDPKNLTPEQLESTEVFAPKFNHAGLIIAIASDAVTNEILMVAYMNREALALTLQTGIVHYYSRSRSSLWKKGETSGETQKLMEMRTDCDQDALLLKVEQQGRGAACHTGRKSCFYRHIVEQDGSISLITDDQPPLFNPDKVYS